MKNRKWGTALIAALLCLCMAFSACSNDADSDSDPDEVVGQDWRTWGQVVSSGTIVRNGENTDVLVCVDNDGAYFYLDEETQVLYDYVEFPKEYGLTSGNYNDIAFEDGNLDDNTDVAIQFMMDDDKQLILVWVYDETTDGYVFFDEILDNDSSDTQTQEPEEIISNPYWEHETYIEDVGGQMHVADATVGVQTYYPYDYIVMEVIDDALVIYDNRNDYAVARCINDIFANYDGAVEDFAIEYAHSYIYADFDPLYGIVDPIVDMDIVDLDNPSDLAQMDGFVYDSASSAYVRLYIYTDAEGNVMAKTFYVMYEDALPAMEEMTAGVNHTACFEAVG